MMCQLPVELIASYSSHILIMEHADHRDSASLMRHALRNFCTLVCGLYLAHITPPHGICVSIPVCWISV